jgi:hypothetical protein
MSVPSSTADLKWMPPQIRALLTSSVSALTISSIVGSEKSRMWI